MGKFPKSCDVFCATKFLYPLIPKQNCEKDWFHLITLVEISQNVTSPFTTTCDFSHLRLDLGIL